MSVFPVALLSFFLLINHSSSQVPSFCAERLENPRGIKVDGFVLDYIKSKVSGHLKRDYDSLPWGKLNSTNEADKDENRGKNRHPDFLAYDNHRVKLHNFTGNSDYINANWVDGVEIPNRYIITQCPVPQTFDDFWTMVWENNVHVLVVLTDLVEGEKRQCDKYWPVTKETYGIVNVTFKGSDDLGHYIIRRFRLQNEDKTRFVNQYHFLHWSDNDVPKHVMVFLDFVKNVRKDPNYESNKPLVAHCSTGTGRAPTFVTTDAMIEAAKTSKPMDFTAYVCHLRQRRYLAIPNLTQFTFSNDVLATAILKDLL